MNSLTCHGIAGFLIMVLLAPGTAVSQWSPDSLQNLEICDLGGDQVVPKISATSDGGCFISWFDSRSSGYCMYIQRLDSLGNEMFGDDGLMVSDHPQMSWLVDYDLAVDPNDNAVLAFSDIRYTGDLDVTAYMIGSDGSFIWGDDGICLSDTTALWFEPAAKVTVTPEGNTVVCWGRSDVEYEIVFQKISPSGIKLWGQNGIVWTSGESDLSAPDVASAGQDSVVAIWKSSTGSYPAQITHLYAQKFDISGDMAWGDTYMLIYDGGAITPWNYPELASDGQGGAVYFWYDAPSLSEFNVWVQRVDANGNMLFPMNGAQASTNSSDRLHMNPSAVYYPSGDQTFVFWVETNANQTMFGMYGQRFSSTGAREWTDSGLQLVPLGGDQVSFVRALDEGGGIYAGYLVGNSGTAVRTIRVGYDGTAEWGPVTLSAASLGGKDDLVTCGGYCQSALYAWTDYRNDYGTYAQNINTDGTLGPQTGIEGATVPADLELTLYPSPSKGAVTVSFCLSSGGSVLLEVYDITGRLVDTMESEGLGAGSHSISWDGRSAAPGIYFIRFTSEDGELSRRLVIL